MKIVMITFKFVFFLGGPTDSMAALTWHRTGGGLQIQVISLIDDIPANWRMYASLGLLICLWTSIDFFKIVYNGTFLCEHDIFS